MRRARRLPAALLHAAAGTWKGAGPDTLGPLRRIPSPEIGYYQRLIRVPIGNDGIAFPQTFIGAAGAATAQCIAGPQGVGTRWEPAQAYAYTSVGALDSALVAFYLGPAPIAQYQIAANLQGGGAQVALGGFDVDPGWFVFAVWSHGTPGATANLIVTGDKTALTI